VVARVPLARVAVLRLEAAAARAGVRVLLVRLAELVAGSARGVVVGAGVVAGVGVAGVTGTGVADVAAGLPLVDAGVSGVGLAASAAGGATLPAPAAGVEPEVVPVLAEGAVRVRRAMVLRGEGSGSVRVGRCVARQWRTDRWGLSRRVPRNR
jgi:hypothetical protein